MQVLEEKSRDILFGALVFLSSLTPQLFPGIALFLFWHVFYHILNVEGKEEVTISSKIN
jgi:hypothetical protein